MRKRNVLALLLSLAFASVTSPARATDLPAFDASDCHGDRECVGKVSDGPYLILALAWNKFMEEDKEFCVAHEEYAKHYSGFYYKGILDCLTVQDFKRANVD